MSQFFIIGAGFAGSVCARQLAEAGHQVTIMDKRHHIGGNAYDAIDADGVLIHPYGPHIFHTNSDLVFNYLSRFTAWRGYEHRVLAEVDGALYPMPINRTTINQLYGLTLDEAGVAQFLAQQRVPRAPIQTSEDVVLNSVGADLCAKFFRGYTRKQWGLDLHQLSAGVAARIPTRTNDDDRYFTDTYQYMPSAGYGAMFQRLLEHPAIQIKLGYTFQPEHVTLNPTTRVIYTGPIDAFFNYCYGKLPYRSLRFEHQHLVGNAQYQRVGTVNYPNTQAYTRITEFKHLTGQTHTGTSIVKEYAQSEGEPYYPIPRPENEQLYQRYAALAEEQQYVTFVGRLAQYRYYNMDQIVAAALRTSQQLIESLS